MSREVEVTFDDVDDEWTLFEDEPTEGRVYNRVNMEEFNNGEKLYTVYVLSEDLKEGACAGIDLIRGAL